MDLAQPVCHRAALPPERLLWFDFTILSNQKSISFIINYLHIQESNTKKDLELGHCLNMGCSGLNQLPVFFLFSLVLVIKQLPH